MHRAIILAAGRGERMRPLTDVTPKALLEVAGKALIRWHIERLIAAGFTDLVINVAHLGALIEQALGDGYGSGARIVYSRETNALETAGGIANALPLLGDAAFLAVNADIYTDFDFARLRGKLRELSPEHPAHLVLVANPEHHPAGDFLLRGDRVQDTDLPNAPRLTFSGIGAYHPALFASIVPRSKAPLAPLLRAAMRAGGVSGEEHQGVWLDIGTPQRLSLVNQMLQCKPC